MKPVLSTLPLIAAVALAQERCDAAYPNVYCNTTEILAFEGYDCKPYHVFIARGSDEPYPGRQGNLTSQICSKIGSNECSYENIEYPAKSTAWGKEEWCKSAAKGAQAGQAQFSGYSQKCPDSKLILLGFSQGASVAQDILGGGGGPVFECEQATNGALDSSVGDKVVAAVTFGAVARSRDQNFTVGEGRPYDGTRARNTEQMAALSKYSDRLRDYCHFGDPICAVGSTPADVGAHLDYFVKHNEEVTSWVVEKAKAKPEKVSLDTSTSTTSTETTKASTSAPTTPSTITNPMSPSSIIAKSAAMPTTTPELFIPTPRPATDTSKAAPAKSANTETGAASNLMPFSGCASFVAVMALAMAFVL